MIRVNSATTEPDPKRHIVRVPLNWKGLTCCACGKSVDCTASFLAGRSSSGALTYANVCEPCLFGACMKCRQARRSKQCA